MRFRAKLNIKRNLFLTGVATTLTVIFIVLMPILTKSERYSYLGEGIIYILLISIGYFIINVVQLLKKIKSESLIIDSSGIASPRFKKVGWDYIQWYSIFRDRIIFSGNDGMIYTIIFDDFDKSKDDIVISARYFTDQNNVAFKPSLGN